MPWGTRQPIGIATHANQACQIASRTLSQSEAISRECFEVVHSPLWKGREIVVMRSLLVATTMGILASHAVAQPRSHNVVLFVADGLRPGMVNERTAPAMTALLSRGVRFCRFA